jgi:hypothetical protein
MTADSLTLDADTQALLSDCEARHGQHVALRALVQIVGAENFERGIDSFYEEYPENEPEETQHLFSELSAMYDANWNWMRKAIREAMTGFDWTAEELSTEWREWLEAVLLASELDQSATITKVLDANGDNEPWLEDVFAICEAINEAKPFALVQMANGLWPDPADKADAPIKPIEQALKIKFKTKD